MAWLIPVLGTAAYVLVGVAIAVVALRRGFGEDLAYDDHDDEMKPLVAGFLVFGWPTAVFFGIAWLLGLFGAGVVRLAERRRK